jgi:hypothetical protein
MTIIDCMVKTQTEYLFYFCAYKRPLYVSSLAISNEKHQLSAVTFLLVFSIGFVNLTIDYE